MRGERQDSRFAGELPGRLESAAQPGHSPMTSTGAVLTLEEDPLPGSQHQLAVDDRIVCDDDESNPVRTCGCPFGNSAVSSSIP